MQIKVASQVYRVEVRDVVTNEEGEEVIALCDYARRLILLSATTHRDRRRTELRHEVYHAFSHAFPGRRDEEDQADFSASVSDDLDAQMAAMGGWSRLDALFEFREGRERLERVIQQARQAEAQETPPLDWHEVTQRQEAETPAMSAAGRAQCGKCETVIADGSIATSAPWWDEFARGLVVLRTLYCPHCDHIQQWQEGATPRGAPNGAVVRLPEYDQDREAVNAFLAMHPRAVGLIAE